MPALRLTYFDAPGRAEPIRVALRMAGLPFEDVRLAFPAFMAAKAAGQLPLGAVPMLEVDGLAITQTAAILRYVARLADTGLYPADPLAALRVDSALDSLNDTLSHALTPSLFERDTEKKLAMRAEFAAGPMARVYGYLEGLLAAGGGAFLGGSAPSIADLVLALQVEQVEKGGLDGLSAAHLEAYPRARAAAAATLAHPAVAAAR